MKKLFTLAFILATTLLFGQSKNDKKIFLDSMGRETTNGNHKYYRIIKDFHLNKEHYEISDYYLNGQMKSEGDFKSNSGISKIGQHKEFYKSGKLKSSINYVDGLPIGIFYTLYENDSKEIDGEYIKFDKSKYESHLKIHSYWDENGTQKVIDGNGFMIEKKEFEYSRGKITNGLKDGMWVGYNAQRKIQFADKYEVGIFKGGVSKDTSNTEYGYLEIEKQPEFKPGWQTFGSFVTRNFRIPDVNKNIKGRVILEFIVSSDGQVQKVEIVRSLEKSFDIEAVRMIYSTSNLGLWVPGEYRGRKVDCKFALPLAFDVRSN